MKHDKRKEPSRKVFPNGIETEHPDKGQIVELPLPKEVKKVLPDVEIRIVIPNDKKEVELHKG
jgi:hypothetical protein